MENRIKAWISLWKKRGYDADIPDEADPVLESLNKVPSYKRICICIFKNDLNFTGLGFQRRKTIIYNHLKKIEIMNRETTKKSVDLFGEEYECL